MESKNEQFFMENELQVNQMVCRILLWLTLAFPVLFLFSYLGIFKVSFEELYPVTPLGIICTISPSILKRYLPANMLKYCALAALNIFMAIVASNHNLGIYITYVLAFALGCLYFDIRFTYHMAVFGYVCMVAAVFLRAHNAVLGKGETPLSWFLAYIMGFTIEYIAMSAVFIAITKRARKLLERVYGMQFGIITFMAEVVENRDSNTGGHIKRTAKYVECIAQELKRQGIYSDILTDRYLSDMVVAAPLHDLGKIHIGDAILNKPGKLTEEEFELIKTHTTAGEELLTHAKAELGESGYLNTAVEMAAYHHEWWNGKGYPYGISGKDIPLCARIMAVADVFDALTSRRCYKNAMPLEKAYAIIREESGTHFDPAVVEAFFAVAADMEKGRDEIK